MQNRTDTKATANLQRRILRERKTMRVLVHLYCRQQHGSLAGVLCPVCKELLDYAMSRLSKCPFGSAKSVCAKCLIHCYRADMRERVREIMRCAGPRLLRRHPILAVRHLLDAQKKPPRLEGRDKVQRH